IIKPQDIPPPYNESVEGRERLPKAFFSDSLKDAKREFEKAFLEAKLRQYNWNISQTAEAIGIERSNLHKKIKAYGLEEARA
ncbi:MAG TPA: sigma-54-dependent Fis family transcriptional regulator, partial [Desulfobacterales bacterium]|nr:sigma-54-dependent Fis family transcriptional regulator [Desulfobacterales bacterium]